MPSTPKQNTPLRHSLRHSSIQPEEEESIILDYTPLQTSKSTRNSNIPPPRTPEMQKRKLDFKSLYNYGFQGPPKPVSPKLAPPAKKARIIAIEDSQASSQALSIPDNNDRDKDILEEKKRQPNAAGKRTWW